MTEKPWNQMTPEEKRAWRLERWRNPGVPFASPEAEEAYKARINRLIAAINLEEADRVPVSLTAGWAPADLAGMTPYEAMTDTARAAQAWVDFNLKFQFDVMITPVLQTTPAAVFETLDYRLYSWPGHGVAKTAGYQYNEKEWMLPEEYDHLIADPTDYMVRVYLPRTVGAFAGFANLTSFFDFIELPFVSSHVGVWGTPEMAESVERLQKAGKLVGEWAQVIFGRIGELITLGFPAYWGGSTKAPFDILGDTLRGTRNVVLDLYRRPDKVLAACERLTQVAIDFVTRRPGMPATPVIFIPLHKGADGFMSDEQFRTFYWPSLKATLLGLINEGYIPFLFAEGGYNSRLEIIKELPKASTIWLFDQTDMARAKETIGQVACIQGNVPLSLLCTGTPDEVINYARRLIEVAGKGGGFVLDAGAVLDTAKADNIHALVKAAQEYGRYR
ncbi:MAG: uroporphyrinogen decarboxylase [Thermoleophilia bacterium]|nr:uroporphyrinogen decarboxylase [Thermoleophilia bacterium]